MKKLIIKLIRLRYYLIRKLSLKIGRKDIVLEIGPGGKPHFRSNVICDKFYNDNTERGGDELYKKKAFLVLGDAEDLPFKQKSFDYIVASHLLEHLYRPNEFFNEIIRVGKAGYIETPTLISEKIKSIKYHVNFVQAFNKENKIKVMVKKRWLFDEDLSKWWLSIRDKTIAGAKINYSDHFFLRFFWKDSFQFETINNEDFDQNQFFKSNESDNAAEETKNNLKVKYSILDKLFRSVIIPFIGYLKYSKGSKFKIEDKVCCPICKSDLSFKFAKGYVICESCKVKYKSEKNILFLRKEDAIALS